MAMIYRADVPGVIFNHEISEGSNQLAHDFNDKLQALGVKSYAYFFSERNKKSPHIVTNLPAEWLSEYDEEGLYTVDPVLDISKNTMLPFSWKTQGLNKEKNNRLAANALRYNIMEGQTFVSVSHGKDIGVLSLCQDDNNNKLNADNKQLAAFIQFELISYHECYSKQSCCNNITSTSPIAALSWREREVLCWTGKGKTYSESAIILGISERTIKFHMSNIKSKLGVFSSRQAVSIATECGLLDSM